MQPDLNAIGFAYPSVPGDARATIATAIASAPEVPPGTFVLSTCLRAEIVVDGDRRRLDDVTTALLGAVPDVPGASIRTGVDAAVHLFRVAAGLESPIRGEIEVLTQFRRAVRSAKDRGVDGAFGRLLEAAVAAGRDVRQLMPESPHDSLAAVAAQVAGSPESVAVLGNGVVANAVVEALQSLPAPPHIVVVARTPGIPRSGGVVEWPFARAAEALARFPVVVSATSAKRRVLPEEEFEAAIAGRTEPLLLIDMAMPPDFGRPAPGDGVGYVGIDDLAVLAGRRHHDDTSVELLTDRAEEAHARFVGHHRVGPVIEHMLSDADEVVAGTVARFAGRLRDGDDEAVLRQTAHTVARTLLAGPLGYLNGVRSPDEVDVVAAAFGSSPDGGDGGG